MNTADKSYDAKQAQLPGKAEPLETLKALARALARQAAAEPVSGVDPVKAPNKTGRFGGKSRQLSMSKRQPHAICCAHNRKTPDRRPTAEATRSNAVMSSTSKTGTTL